MRKVILDRWQQLELKGKRVIVHETAASFMIEELHMALKELDPDYDRKYSAIKDLPKMKVLAELLADSKHCLDTTYLFELYSCGDPSCKFGCEEWPTVEEGSAEALLQAALRKQTPLPRLRLDGVHFMGYEESCALAENDERDLPSAKESAPKELLKARKAMDKTNSSMFVVSKMRDAVSCNECSRPRLIYSMTKPKAKELQALDAYKEGIDYQCGDSLFDDDAEGDDKQLAETFHVRRAITCRDPMEQSYFNHGNVRGCVDLEWVCSRCGAGPNESPLDPKTCGRGDVTGYSGFAFSKGQMMLPTCMTCMAKWQASGDKKLAPILVGTTNQVDKERSRQEAKAKQRASKKAAAEASSEEEEPEVGADAEEEEEEEAGEAAGSSGEKRKAREQRPAPQSSSSTSGAAKRRAKAAAASPPSLAELVDSALSSFRQRKQLSLYRSMLRAAVRKIDPAKRAFGDKAEWVGLLQTLQQDGLLTYTAATDSIVISAVQDV